MPHIPAVVIPFLLLAALFCGGFYAGASFERTRKRPMLIILLSVLLVAVSLYAGFAAGGYRARMRADSLAHNTLRNLSFGLQNAQESRRQDLRAGRIDASELYTMPKLPIGVYALSDGDSSRPMMTMSEPAIPIACISPGYDPHVFIVLFSNHNREKMTIMQLEEALGVDKYHTSYDLRGLRKRSHSE